MGSSPIDRTISERVTLVPIFSFSENLSLVSHFSKLESTLPLGDSFDSFIDESIQKKNCKIKERNSSALSIFAIFL